jgi:hypothetical protein
MTEDRQKRCAGLGCLDSGEMSRDFLLWHTVPPPLGNHLGAGALRSSERRRLERL